MVAAPSTSTSRRFGARYAYTIDGSAVGELEGETFCADTAIVTVTGADVHPGYAKGKMVNAVRVLSDLVMALPQHRTPETTEEREGYLHPISIAGNVSEAKVQFLVRDFTEEGLHELEELLRAAALWQEQKYPGAKVAVESQGVLPQHEVRAGPVPGRDGVRRGGDSAGRPRGRSARRSAAAPTARASASWASRRRTSPTAA